MVVGEQQQLDLLDMITIFTAIIQVVDYEQTVNMASNNDIMREMHRQNAEYLQQIMQHNEQIILLLEQLKQKLS